MTIHKHTLLRKQWGARRKHHTRELILWVAGLKFRMTSFRTTEFIPHPLPRLLKVAQTLKLYRGKHRLWIDLSTSVSDERLYILSS